MEMLRGKRLLIPIKMTNFVLSYRRKLQGFLHLLCGNAFYDCL